jgi:hypothetical protein
MRFETALRAGACTALLLGGALVTEVMAIVVAPTGVYMTDRNPAAAVTLYNPTDIPEEVSVETLFGYPTTDEDGNVRMAMDPEGRDPRSAAGWIRALPRRLVVPPGERRTVRLLAQPPAEIPDGEYWTRLVFTSRGQKLPVEGVPDSSGVQVGLNLAVRTVIAATFRKGEVSTGMEVLNFEPRIEGDSLVVHPHMIRQGNAAYIGLAEFSLVNEAGEEARAWTAQIAAYRDYARRFAYDVSDLPSGEYRLTFRLSTEREDIALADRLATVPVELSAPVALP